MSGDTLSPEAVDEFRARCRAFLEEHAVGIHLGGDADPRGDRRLAQAKVFQKAAAEAGLAGIPYPKEFGGQGLTLAHERIWREELARFPVMTGELTISQGMCLPMLNEYGSDEQKARFLGPNISGEEVWCQMFSEPGAGSDVASLQTTAVRDGDEWVVNGQKVWTTLAHLCDYGILIARTEPDAPKHRGISMFIVDMKAPGVEVRPINQIDGGKHFNEIFFTDVRIPVSHQIGPLNEGWRLATAMLMYERVAIGAGGTSGVRHEYADALISEAQKSKQNGDPNLRQELVRLYTAETIQSLMSMRTRAELKAGRTPGPGGSLGKLIASAIVTRAGELSMALAGASSQAWLAGGDGGRLAQQRIRAMGLGIAGGTTEIQKNIIGDRVLGLPREPSVDRELPFKELKVGTQR